MNRSDNGPEVVAQAVRGWLDRRGVGTLVIEPGTRWEEGYIESFNGKLPYELLGGEILDPMLESRIIIERWQKYYTERPHTSLLGENLHL
ncbi:MAG TPA: transposase [Bacteroidota bacterium]|nr:transposase [Bacteroidota bacterium]